MSLETWPDLAGRLRDGVHVLAVRVYYEDTDFSGVVYHASYLRFMERGRSDFVRLSGVGHAELFDEAVAGASFTLAQAVRRGAETLVTARVVAALVDPQGRPRRIPAHLRTRLAQGLAGG